MQIDLTEVTVVLGQKNSGKSVLLEHLLTKINRYVALDPNHEHGPPDARAVTSPAELLKEWMRGNTRIVVRDAPLSKAKTRQYLRAFGQLKDAYLLIDEAHNYMSYASIPPELKDIAKWHLTHNNCGLILGAHQAKEIHDQIWNQTDNYLIFAYGDHEDSKLEQATIPDKQIVHNLDPNEYRFLWYKDVAGSKSEVRGPVSIPEHLS